MSEKHYSFDVLHMHTTELRKGMLIAPHKHNSYQLYAVAGGEVIYHCDGCVFTLKDGGAVVVAPEKRRHIEVVSCSGTALVVLFNSKNSLTEKFSIPSFSA